MALRMRRAVAWLGLLLIPCHILTALYLDLLGPAHFHLDHELHEHDDSAHHHHEHRHIHAEQHTHPLDDATVVMVDDDASFESHAPEESATTGGAAASFLALVSGGLPSGLQLCSIGVQAAPESLPESRFPERLERPPRLDGA